MVSASRTRRSWNCGRRVFMTKPWNLANNWLSNCFLITSPAWMAGKL
jgi:hypothetical protein